jgi:hypothetical protein
MSNIILLAKRHLKCSSCKQYINKSEYYYGVLGYHNKYKHHLLCKINNIEKEIKDVIDFNNMSKFYNNIHLLLNDNILNNTINLVKTLKYKFFIGVKHITKQENICIIRYELSNFKNMDFESFIIIIQNDKINLICNLLYNNDIAYNRIIYKDLIGIEKPSNEIILNNEININEEIDKFLIKFKKKYFENNK